MSAKVVFYCDTHKKKNKNIFTQNKAQNKTKTSKRKQLHKKRH